MHLTFWQPIPSFHQEGLLNALTTHPEVSSLTLKVESTLHPERQAAGWQEPSLPGVEVQTLQTGEVPESAADQVHIFTGFDTHTGVWDAFHRLPADAACRCYAYTEAPHLRGWKGVLRRMRYYWVFRVGRQGGKEGRSLRKPLSGLQGIFAVGDRGETFYRQISRGQVPVIPFGYYDVSADAVPESVAWRGAEGSDFLFVGQFIRCKGVDLLFRALAEMTDRSWRLRLAGRGPEEAGLKRLADRLGIQGRIDWLGVLGREALREEYRNARCLVVPSRVEGWGMAVNEAVREGCPVRASVMAPASCLLPDEWTVQPTPSALRHTLTDVLAAADPQSEGEKALACAGQTTGEVGAGKMMAALLEKR